MTTQSYMPLGEFFRRILVLGAFGLTALVIWRLRIVIMMLFLAIIIAISMDVPVRRLQERGLRRGLAIIGVTTTVVLFLILVGIIIGTPLVVQTEALIDELPQAIDTLAEDYAAMSQDIGFLPDVDLDVDSSGDQQPLDPNIVASGASVVTAVGGSAISAIINLVLVIIVALYLLAEPKLYADSFLALVPKTHQLRILEILIDLREALVAWLVAQLISMTIIGVLTGTALGFIWGIPNAFALGMFAGIMTIIPNIGTVIAMIPAVIFTLADRPEFVLPVIATYLVVQQIESNLLMPIIVKQRLSIPAAALLVFQVIMGVLLGFMGLLLAVPFFMVIKELVRELYVEDVLNNINTAIEARNTEEGETVVRVTGDNYRTSEIPLKRIFKGANPFEQSVNEIVDEDAVPEEYIEPFEE